MPERVPKFQVGDRVAARAVRGGLLAGRIVGRTGVIVRTEVLGDTPANSSAIAAAVHNPGALIYVVRHRAAGVVPVEMAWEEDEIDLATSA